MSDHKWSAAKQLQALKLREEGLSYARIGLQLQVDGSTVRKHLDPVAALQATWAHIKQRCYNPADERYPHYGARGIELWEPWRDDYRKFAEDIIELIGSRPTSRHSLDRINNAGDYEPGNLRWALPREQALNRSGSSQWANISVSKPRVFTKKISPYLLKVTLSKVFVTEEDALICAEILDKEFGDTIVDMAKFLENWSGEAEAR